MSEPIPESIPTSMDPRSHRPSKKRALTPTTSAASQITALFKKPDRAIDISGPKPKTLPPPAEIVANVQGSSAGAGSGEFHVYKASRRREMERVKMMESEVREEEDREAFEREMEEKRRRDEEKTARNRAKRQKKKGKKGGKEDKMEVEKTGGTTSAVNGNGTGKTAEELKDVPVSQDVGLVIRDEDE